jgi:hypothetical protein
MTSNIEHDNITRKEMSPDSRPGGARSHRRAKPRWPAQCATLQRLLAGTVIQFKAEGLAPDLLDEFVKASTPIGFMAVTTSSGCTDDKVRALVANAIPQAGGVVGEPPLLASSG